MPNQLVQIAQRVLHTPLLLDPAKAEIIYGVLEGRIKVDAKASTDSSKPEAAGFIGSRTEGGKRTHLQRAKGVGIIRVHGSLVNRGAWIDANSGLTSYEGISAQIAAAKADPDVDSLIIDIDTPGGEATGMFTLAEQIRDARASGLYVVAVINDMAASAGFGIASAADEIVGSPTSIVGSIGVVMLHMDRSGEMEKRGISATLIHSGANKVDGHPFAALSDDVKASLQASCDAFYDRFLDTVAAGRGNKMNADQARATQARTYIGQAAIDIGLMDRFGTLSGVLSELQTSNREKPMTETTTIEMSAHTAAVATARAEGGAEATTRIKTILTSDAAKGREATAQSFAFNTEMTSEQAVAALATIPAGAPAAAATTDLAAFMTVEQRAAAAGAEIGADSDDIEVDTAAQTAALWKSVTEEQNAR